MTVLEPTGLPATGGSFILIFALAYSESQIFDEIDGVPVTGSPCSSRTVKYSAIICKNYQSAVPKYGYDLNAYPTIQAII